MKYKVSKKRTLLVGKEKIQGGKTIPAGIIKKIGEQGVKSLLKDGAILEVKDDDTKTEKKPEQFIEIKKEESFIEMQEEKDELEKHTRDELFQMAEELDLDLPSRSSKGELIDAIRKEME